MDVEMADAPDRRIVQVRIDIDSSDTDQPPFLSGRQQAFTGLGKSIDAGNPFRFESLYELMTVPKAVGNQLRKPSGSVSPIA
jgi:hypothetical protein